MVRRLLEQEEAIRVVLSFDRKFAHLVPTWQDIDVLESLSKALSPVADLTDFLSGEKHISISSVLPVLYNLTTKVLVKQDNDTELTKTIKKKIIESLNARYTDSKVKELLEVSTFLDPQFKSDYTETESETVLIELVSKYVEEQELTNTLSSDTSNTQDFEEQPEPPPKKRKLLMFLQKTSSNESNQIPSSTTTSLIEKEIESYLHCPKLAIDSDTSVLEWWKINSTNYPNLSRLAKKYLCIPATSCPSERLFSTSGNIVTPSRAMLKPEKVNMLMFLTKNLD